MHPIRDAKVSWRSSKFCPYNGSPSFVSRAGNFLSAQRARRGGRGKTLVDASQSRQIKPLEAVGGHGVGGQAPGQTRIGDVETSEVGRIKRLVSPQVGQPRWPGPQKAGAMLIRRYVRLRAPACCRSRPNQPVRPAPVPTGSGSASRSRWSTPRASCSAMMASASAERGLPSGITMLRA